MEASVTITMYLGSSTSEFELASLDYFNSSYSSQTTASGKHNRTTYDQTEDILENMLSNQ